MKKHSSNTKDSRTGSQKEKKGKKEAFAFYIGIDLGDKNCDVCVMNGEGEVSEEFRLAMKVAEFQKYFVTIGRSRVAVEAGGQSRWVAETIQRCGHEVYVSDTRKVAYIHDSDEKADPEDAYKLAELVHFKPRLLHPIQHRSAEVQADLSWIRAREGMVASRTQLINLVRGISKGFGERLGKCSTESFTSKRAAEIPEAIRGAVAPLLETIDHLNEQIRYYDQMEAHLAAKRYGKHWLLEQVDGVGVHTSLSFMLTIGDGMRRPVSLAGCDKLPIETALEVQKETGMKKHSSNTKDSRTGSQKEKKGKKEAFAFYIGIDLGDKNCDVCVMNGEGEVSEEFRLAMKVAEFQKYFVTIGRSRVAVEAGGQSRWVAETIQRCGHEVYVSDTRKVAYIHDSDEKADPEDAYKLAELVHFKPRLLHPIQHRSAEVQADLSWIRAREGMVASRTQLINLVRGISKGFGERLGKCSTESFTSKRAAEIPEAIRGAVAPLLETIDHLNEQIRYYDQMEAHLAAKRYGKHWLLEQVDGVGVHTSLSFMLTIGDAERFAKSRTVGAFLGMRPKQKDSGAGKPQLGITKAGDEYLRKTLVNCAHYILGPYGKDSDLRRYGQRICERGGRNAKKRAVIAVARKLAVLLHRLWVSGEVYEPLRNSQAKPVAA